MCFIKFPSIWIEETREHEKNLLIGGFYREWSHEGRKSSEIQLEAIKIFCSQIEKASSEGKNIIIQGDANLCSEKWQQSDFLLCYLSDELIGTLAQCGIENVKLGNTYLADRLSNDRLIIESALDHTYISSELKSKSTIKNLVASSTDHVPITATIARS